VDSVSEAHHHLVINIDVHESGRRDNQEKLAMRAVLYDTVSGALGVAEVPRAECTIEDRGDGMLIIVTAAVPESRLVGVWQEDVHNRLTEHNKDRPKPQRIRVRVGMHAGQLHHDEHGVAGADVDLACRLGESAPARATLQYAHAAQLVTVVSESLYQSVVRQSGRFIEPDSYRQIQVRHKEVDTVAWLHVPGCSVAPAPPNEQQPAEEDKTIDYSRHDRAPLVGRIDGPAAVFGKAHITGPFVVGTMGESRQDGAL
jgi:hypothetical protein